VAPVFTHFSSLLMGSTILIGMKNTTVVKCAYCENDVVKSTSEVTRALKMGRPQYCSLSCGARHAAKKRNLKELNINEYNSSPKKCNGCGCDIPYEKRHNDFCSQSCSAVFHNRRRKLSISDTKSASVCKNCGKECNSSTLQFCSVSCSISHKRSKYYQKIEAGDTTLDHRQYRRYLIEKRGAKCELCGWGEVNPKTGNCPIELEHIDGNHENNSLDNLKLMCNIRSIVI